MWTKKWASNAGCEGPISVEGHLENYFLEMLLLQNWRSGVGITSAQPPAAGGWQTEQVVGQLCARSQLGSSAVQGCCFV